MQRAKEATIDENLSFYLIEVKNNYEQLVLLLDNLEKNKLTMEEAYKAIKSLSFDDNVANVKDYINLRLKNNEISDLLNLKNYKITIYEHSYLFKCLPTTVAVERSFSMIKKLLASDRNFKTDNI